MERTILHCDLNNFFASVECLYRPELRNIPVIICGDPEKRHGIVLAKNYPAKRHGIITGEPIWQAKKKCADVVMVPPNYDRYIRFSRLAREIYARFTPQIQDFGIDECWLDVTGSAHLFGGGKQIADTIRAQIKAEMGVTVSVGVSFNKIFAKFGSDLRKPDYTTVISRGRFREILWPLPVNELLYVGPSTNKKLRNIGVHTIGALAALSPETLKSMLGIPGIVLWRYANGMDSSEVTTHEQEPTIKSIGNSTTTPKDLRTQQDAKITLYALCESVAARLREQGFHCKTVQLYLRDVHLVSKERQCKTEYPVCTAYDLFHAAFALYEVHRGSEPLRSIGVRACDLIFDEYPQLSIWPAQIRSQRQEALENTVERLRERFGYTAVRRGIMLADRTLADLNPKQEHTVHPVAYLP